jgi:hypothetical protein
VGGSCSSSEESTTSEADFGALGEGQKHLSEDREGKYLAFALPFFGEAVFVVLMGTVLLRGGAFSVCSRVGSSSLDKALGGADSG